MLESWKEVKGYDYPYKVSNMGNVYSYRLNRNMKLQDSTWGYYRVSLVKNGKKQCVCVHKLVAEAFIPNPENKEQVNHKNGDRKDNRVENLEWVTRSENVLHRYRVLNHGNDAGIRALHRSVELRKIPVLCVEKNKTFNSIAEASKWLAKSDRKWQRQNIKACCDGKPWARTVGGYHWIYTRDKNDTLLLMALQLCSIMDDVTRKKLYEALHTKSDFSEDVWCIGKGIN